MEKKEYQIYTHYTNYKGGINNLQTSVIYCGNIKIKVFTSAKHQAEKRAEKWIKNNQ